MAEESPESKLLNVIFVVCISFACIMIGFNNISQINHRDEQTKVLKSLDVELKEAKLNKQNLNNK